VLEFAPADAAVLATLYGVGLDSFWRLGGRADQDPGGPVAKGAG
jgi:hypothetical protein